MRSKRTVRGYNTVAMKLRGRVKRERVLVRYERQSENIHVYIYICVFIQRGDELTQQIR